MEIRCAWRVSSALGVIGLCMASLSAAQSGPGALADNLAAGRKQTIVTYGTSLTAGGAWVKQLGSLLNARYPGLANVINSGGSGKWSQWAVQNLDERVLKKNPDAVLIEFGINDAFLQYKTSPEDARKNLETMIERILKHNPKCQIILMTMNPPVGVHLERRPRIEEYYEMYRDVARQRKLLLIDHHVTWKALLKENPALFAQYVPDGIHPNATGCEKIITPAIAASLFADQNSATKPAAAK